MRNLIFVLVVLILLGLAMYVVVSNNTTEVPVDTPAPIVEEPSVPELDYLGLPEAEAAELAVTNGVAFRVVERDGETQIVTEDFVLGRINAAISEGVVTSYTVESGDTVPSPEQAHNEIIGLSEAEAEAYAEAAGVSFRVGFRDGEALPVTMDYQPGRITAQIEGGAVVSYTTE